MTENGNKNSVNKTVREIGNHHILTKNFKNIF